MLGSRIDNTCLPTKYDRSAEMLADQVRKSEGNAALRLKNFASLSSTPASINHPNETGSTALIISGLDMVQCGIQVGNS